MPPEDAEDLQEQAGALRFPSRGRNRPPRAAPPRPSRRRLAAGGLTPKHPANDPLSHLQVGPVA